MKIDNSQVANRLKSTREYLDIAPETLAAKTGISPAEYLALEKGEAELSLSFLNECAIGLGIELIGLLTGEEPRLQQYNVVRRGEGLPIERRAGFSYQELAFLFKKKKIEPLAVTAPYEAGNETAPVHLSRHDGQEWDYVLSGQLRFVINDHEEFLEAGDSVYYNSGNKHGMVAVGGEECVFLAILI